jgi:uncharacterized DUF497 family protein
VIYEWDAVKAKANLRKHRVSFEETAARVSRSLALTFADPDHSGGEEREITIGRSARQLIVFVSHCLRRDRIRIISARKATKGERKQYEQDLGEEIQ